MVGFPTTIVVKICYCRHCDHAFSLAGVRSNLCHMLEVFLLLINSFKLRFTDCFVPRNDARLPL